MNSLVYALVVTIVFGACSKQVSSLPDNEEMLIGKWSHLFKDSIGDIIDTLSFNKDNCFEWILYNHYNSIGGEVRETTKHFGTWRVVNDTLYLFHKDSIQILLITCYGEGYHIIKKLNGDSLYITTASDSIIRKMSRVK